MQNYTLFSINQIFAINKLDKKLQVRIPYGGHLNDPAKNILTY